ncbi:ceramidase domain-containing protein [Microbaculum marinum]|uniref:Ceramidase domain-containing protein n=1 Tax=Microbaculum marinum TaxID=1764581 RepID=A0AAW9RSZ7_9HYPH
MDGSWTSAIDIYCERLGPGFWAEPVNAISNLAFLLAAAAAFVRWRRRAHADWPALVLIGVLTAIGIGSFLFHTYANRWSVLADVIPISIFIYVYFFFAMRRFFGLSVWAALAVTVAFLVASFAIDAVLPRGFLNGSGSYLPAVAAILVVGVLLLGRWPSLARTVLLGGGILVVSITARSIDMAVCASFPLGTHFVWHVLNGVTLYVLLVALMASRTGRPAL